MFELEGLVISHPTEAFTIGSDGDNAENNNTFLTEVLGKQAKEISASKSHTFQIALKYFNVVYTPNLLNSNKSFLIFGHKFDSIEFTGSFAEKILNNKSADVVTPSFDITSYIKNNKISITSENNILIIKVKKLTEKNYSIIIPVTDYDY